MDRELVLVQLPTLEQGKITFDLILVGGLRGRLFDLLGLARSWGRRGLVTTGFLPVTSFRPSSQTCANPQNDDGDDNPEPHPLVDRLFWLRRRHPA